MKKLKNRMKNAAVLLLFIFSANTLLSQAWTSLLSGEIKSVTYGNGNVYALEYFHWPNEKVVIHQLDTATWTDSRIDSALCNNDFNFQQKIQFIGTTGWYNYLSTAGSGSKIRYTTNGGASWSDANFPASTYPLAFHFCDASNGFASAYGSSGPALYKTTDGGVNWTAAGAITSFAILDIYTIDPMNLVAKVDDGISNAYLWFSSNGGVSWTASSPMFGQVQRYSDIYFTSLTNGYITNYDDLYYTTNGIGANPVGAYSPQAYSDMDTLLAITHLGGDTLIVMGTDSKIHTRASGIWHETTMPSAPAQPPYTQPLATSLKAIDKKHLLAATRNGLFLMNNIYEITCPASVTLHNKFNCLTNVTGPGNTYTDSYDYASLNGVTNTTFSYAWTYTNASNITLTTQVDSTYHYDPVSNGTYTVSVIAVNGQGCPSLYDTNVVTINQNYSFVTPYTQNMGVICKGMHTNITLGSGGSSYEWYLNGSLLTTSPLLDTAVFWYSTYHSVVNLNGCKSENDWVYIVDSVRTSITYNPTCVKLGTDSAYATAAVVNGNGPYTYTWGPGPLGTFTTPSVHFRAEDLVQDTYTLTVMDANGCTATTSTGNEPLPFCDNVWPGDADNDLMANNYDVLDLGLNYGSTGPVRSGASITWTPQPATNYMTFKPNGFNIKHDDCNGDGVIDANDTLAIIQNYGLSHAPYKLKNTGVLSGPPLNVQFVADSTTQSSVVTVKVMLGSSSNPANNVYGLAFSLSLDTSLIKPNLGSYNCSNSWLSPGSPTLLSIKKELYNQQRIDMAVCRTNQTNISGYGEVAEVEMIMRDDISGKVMFDYIKTLQMSIFNAKVISANGDTIEVNPGSDSLVVTQTTGISENAIMNHISWYPNPVKNELTINSSDLFHTCSIIAANGSVIYNERQQENTSRKLDVSQLAPGVYMLKLTGDRKTGIIKFVKYD